MSSGLDLEKLKWVFRSRPDILTAIQQAAGMLRLTISNALCRSRLSCLEKGDEGVVTRRQTLDTWETSG
jgi:hypothetical protein